MFRKFWWVHITSLTARSLTFVLHGESVIAAKLRPK
jgi:hypothetical protein